MSSIRLEQYRQTWKRYYNKKVKPRSFVVGDLVLRKIFSKTTQRNAGKCRDNYEGPFVKTEVRYGGNYLLAELDGTPVNKGWNVMFLKKILSIKFLGFS